MHMHIRAYTWVCACTQEVMWRNVFGRAEFEHLVRVYTSCTLSEKSGDLYLGSHSLHFRGKDATIARRGKERSTVSLPYTRVRSITKKSGKLSGYKGFTMELSPARPGDKVEAFTLAGFAWANEVRHMVESLVAERCPMFDRAALEENGRMRAKFGLADESVYVLNEYQVALIHAHGSSMGSPDPSLHLKPGPTSHPHPHLHSNQVALIHADGSSKGKLYVTQSALCFSGSLLGRETRAVFSLSDIIALERTELPALNTVLVTSSTTEERFTFLLDSSRSHALSQIYQLMSLSKDDHSLLAPTELPSQGLELPPEPFLEKPPSLPRPHATLPIALSSSCHIAASCWRYPVRAPLATGCPATVLLQPPLALQNLLPCALEWRLVPTGGNDKKERGKEVVGEAQPVVAYASIDGKLVAVSQEEGSESELPPEQVHDFHLTSPGLPSPPLTSPHTSPHLTSPQATSPRLTSPPLTSPHLTSRCMTSMTCRAPTVGRCSCACPATTGRQPSTWMWTPRASAPRRSGCALAPRVPRRSACSSATAPRANVLATCCRCTHIHMHTCISCISGSCSLLATCCRCTCPTGWSMAPA